MNSLEDKRQSPKPGLSNGPVRMPSGKWVMSRPIDAYLYYLAANLVEAQHVKIANVEPSQIVRRVVSEFKRIEKELIHCHANRAALEFGREGLTQLDFDLGRQELAELIARMARSMAMRMQAKKVEVHLTIGKNLPSPTINGPGAYASLESKAADNKPNLAHGLFRFGGPPTRPASRLMDVKVGVVMVIVPDQPETSRPDHDLRPMDSRSVQYNPLHLENGLDIAAALEAAMLKRAREHAQDQENMRRALEFLEIYLLIQREEGEMDRFLTAQAAAPHHYVPQPIVAAAIEFEELHRHLQSVQHMTPQLRDAIGHFTEKMQQTLEGASLNDQKLSAPNQQAVQKNTAARRPEQTKADVETDNQPGG